MSKSDYEAIEDLENAVKGSEQRIKSEGKNGDREKIYCRKTEVFR